MRRLSAFLTLALSAACTLGQVPEPGTRPFVGHQVHRVTVETQPQLEALEQLGVNIWSCHVGVGPVDVQLRPEDVPRLAAMGLAHELLIADVQAVLDAERQALAAARLEAGVNWYETFRSLDEINALLDQLAAAHPGQASTFTAGVSIEGRAIRGIRFSSPDLPNNPRSQRPVIFFDATQHAREWVAPMTAMYIAETLLSDRATTPRVQNLFDKFEFIIVPVVNVDGYVYTWASTNNRLWRKNRRPNPGGSFGVDTNRNFPFRWGSVGASATQSSDIYRGSGPASEPETQVVRDLFVGNPRMLAHIDFHSYGQYILSPWGYTALPPRDGELYLTFNGVMEAAIEAVHGFDYRPGQSYTRIYPTSGGIKDYAYGALGILSWTVELRDLGSSGFVLPAAQILPNAQEAYAGVLALGDECLTRPLWFSPRGGQTQAHPVPWIASPSGFPTQLQARMPASLYLEVKNGSALLAAPPTLYTRVGSGGFAPSAMTLTSGATFTGTLPAAGPGQVIEFYFEAQTLAGATVRYPDFPAPGYYSARAYDIVTPFNDDVETDAGWIAGLGADTATRGQWQRGAPANTPAQIDHDASPNGTQCWITNPVAGSGVNSNDVDGGITTLISPAIDGTLPAGFTAWETLLTYHRWFSNDQGNAPNTDSMSVSLSLEDGANFMVLENVFENTGDWTRQSWHLAALSSQIRLRFIAGDLGTDSCVEAGVDEVSLVGFGVIRTADFDGDGDTGTDADIEAFFRCLAGDCCALCYTADYNSDGDTGTDADIEAFFRCLAGDCAS
jgi:hypothetical protein